MILSMPDFAVRFPPALMAEVPTSNKPAMFNPKMTMISTMA